jgi:phosphate:Na+ symporter
MSSILAAFVAGLGLFFLGLNLVSSHLKQTSSRQVRSLIARFTKRAWQGSLLGVLAGVCMQSTSAVTVILASMTATGLISVRRALPIVAWTNVGATLIVFATVFDLHLLVLYLLGVSALVFAFAGEMRWKPFCGVILGVGLLFYGIDGMKSSATEVIKVYPWIPDMLKQARGSYLLALLAGTLLSFLTQSTTAVALLAVTLAKAGMFGGDETMMIVYGGNVGSTFARMILVSGLKGSSRQIGHFQDLFKIGGSAVFVLLFYLELRTRWPLVKALSTFLSGNLETQIAFVNLFCNLAPALVLSPLLGPFKRLLDHFWPATEAEDFVKLKYLNPQALSDPESAIDLVEKEQMRLVARLPEYVNALRDLGPGKQRADLRSLHQPFRVLYKEVESYLTSLIHLHISAAGSERLTNVHNRHGVIGFLEDSLTQLVDSVGQTRPSRQLAPLVANVTEALDFLLATAADAVTTLDPVDAAMIAGLCADRGELMSRIRNLYLSSEERLSPQDKTLLLGVTALFDRIVWMVGRLALLLQQSRQLPA